MKKIHWEGGLIWSQSLCHVQEAGDDNDDDRPYIDKKWFLFVEYLEIIKIALLWFNKRGHVTYT